MYQRKVSAKNSGFSYIKARWSLSIYVVGAYIASIVSIVFFS